MTKSTVFNQARFLFLFVATLIDQLRRAIAKDRYNYFRPAIFHPHPSLILAPLQIDIEEFMVM